MSIKSLKLKSSYAILLFVLICSCKKDYPTAKNCLTGDTAIFIGTWDWIYSDHDYGICENELYYEYLDSVNTGISFSISFLSNGIALFKKNQQLISENRMLVTYFENQPQSCMISAAHRFNIHLNGTENALLVGCINSDTMRMTRASGFLFDAESGCENYQNYFLKK